MHRTLYTTRRIPNDQMPLVLAIDGTPSHRATAEDLPHLGIHHLADDLYSVVSIEERTIDPETGAVTWTPRLGPPPGTVVSEGALLARFAALPPSVKSKVLCARILRSSAADSLRARARANLTEAQQIFAARVGVVKPGSLRAPPVVVAAAAISEQEIKAEALRLLGVRRRDRHGMVQTIAEAQTVPMSHVTAEDVIEVSNVIPHRWAGEARE